MAEFKHGDEVTCKIHSEEITDARICVEGGTYFICQDTRSGMNCDNKFGYSYSWRFDPEIPSIDNVYDLKLKNPTNKIKTMNLVEKFKLSRMKEPEKSFVKAGIADTNGNLNSDGKTLVVDPILAEEEEAKK